MAYWPEAKRWATSRSKTFGPWKAITGVLSALVQFFYGRAPLRQTIFIIGTGVGVYLLCYCVDFLWKLLILAPAQIYDGQSEVVNSLRDTSNAEIKRLETALTRKHPADEDKLAHVRNLLTDFSDDERGFIRWLLHNGETAREKLAASGVPQPSVWSAEGKGIKNELLRARLVRTPASAQHFLSVNPSYTEALRDILFDYRPVTPTPA